MTDLFLRQVIGTDHEGRLKCLEIRLYNFSKIFILNI